MKIAVVSFCFNHPTGRRNLRVWQKLAEKEDMEIHIITVDKWGSFNDQTLERDVQTKNLKIYRLKTFIQGYQHRYIMFGLKERIKAIKPDLVFAEDEPITPTTYNTMLCAKSMKIPFIFFTWENIHTNWVFPISHMENSVLKYANPIIAGTNLAKEVLIKKGADPKKIIVNPQTGVDPEIFKPGVPGFSKKVDIKKTILFIGRFLPEKGIETILKAKKILDVKGKEYTYLFIGSGPLEVRLKELKTTTKNILVYDWMDTAKLPSVYNSGSILVYPSYTIKGLIKKWSEQFGFSMVEALMCEVPVIASDAGGPKEIVQNNITGYIVPQKDENELASKIELLMDNPHKRKQFGKAGRQDMVNRFSNKVVAEKLYSILKSSSDVVQ